MSTSPWRLLYKGDNLMLDIAPQEGVVHLRSNTVNLFFFLDYEEEFVIGGDISPTVGINKEAIIK